MNKVFSRNSLLGTNLARGGWLQCGMESVRRGQDYSWDGLRRLPPGEPATWLLQCTVKGWGIFQTDTHRNEVGPHQAFSAVIPSAHVYRGDPACEEWTFFWIMVQHEYVVPRLMSHPELHNRVIALPENCFLEEGARALLEGMAASDGGFVCEEQLFLWMMAMERWLFSQSHPDGPRERLLRWIRQSLISRNYRDLSVEELARSKGMSRSNFTHHFQSATGETPATYLRSLRLEKAASLLKKSRFSIKEIAAQTGFGSSNHFCKAFRLGYHMSPGRYREIAQG